MKLDNFSIYSVLKNEDAHPFIKDGLIVCADGLGGAGSTVHNIDRTAHPNLTDEIREAALCSMTDEGALAVLEPFILRELEPMVDELADTSALWASRIAIIRFAYALGYSSEFHDCDLSDGEKRAELSRFVGEGLVRVKDKFGLEKGKYGGQVVLPTTLAAIRYKSEGESVVAEAVWAGDSRCYVLNEKGLFALSKDDEDDSGAITNLFASDEDAILHYSRFVLEAPCVLLVVSDGAFDPYEPHCHFGVELAIEQCIAESGSYRELEEKLTAHYDSIHGDDTTIAAAVIGFEGFEELKSRLAQRTERVRATWEKLASLSSLLKIQNRSEDDVSGYVKTRTGDKFDAVCKSLLPLIVGGEDDGAIGEELVAMLDGVKRELRDSGERRKAERAANAVNKLKLDVLRNPALAIESLLNETIGADDSVSVALAALRRSAKEHAYLSSELEKKETEYELIRERVGKRIYSEVVDRIAHYRNLADSLRGATSPEEREERRRAVELEYTWSIAELAMIDELPPKYHARLDGEDKELMKDLQCYLVRRGQIRGGALKFFRAKLRKNKEDCEKHAGYLFTLISKNLALVYSLVRSDAQRDYGLMRESSEDGVSAEELISLLSEKMHREKQSAVDAIVGSLKKNPDKGSVIDVYYNATRLAAFRDYYLLRANPREDVREFERELADFEAAFTSLI